ncbi:MAG: AbrB/MazE/SpoVT family DNA-binding domain-containing protein [Sphingomonadaceae bacterium]|nr:AbrB/MazE/SpoVT family DNA-binding domain-containing protein [Sphingomonadaceae bacterium]
MTPAAASTKVTAKGQVTLRRGLLDHIGAKPGDRLEIVPTDAGTLEVRRAGKTGTWDAFFGSIGNDGTPPLTVDEINEAIARGWAGLLDEPDDCD